jgi:hypothetical protein
MGDREMFSMLPKSMTRKLPAMALQLYAYLDDVQQENGDTAKGYRKAAKDLTWQNRTVQHWAEYLARLGIIEIAGESRHARTMTVVHNPARGRVAEDARLPEPERRSGSQRRSYTSKLARDAHQLDEGTGAHEAPQLARHTHQQLARQSTQTDAPDAQGPSSSVKERSESSEALAPRTRGEKPKSKQLTIGGLRQNGEAKDPSRFRQG